MKFSFFLSDLSLRPTRDDGSNRYLFRLLKFHAQEFLVICVVC